MAAGPKKWKWRSTTKARGECSPRCADGIFVGYGDTRRAAKDASERLCQDAGCHTPGEEPYNCDCGHSTLYQNPN